MVSSITWFKSWCTDIAKTGEGKGSRKKNPPFVVRPLREVKAGPLGEARKKPFFNVPSSLVATFFGGFFRGKKKILFLSGRAPKKITLFFLQLPLLGNSD